MPMNSCWNVLRRAALASSLLLGAVVALAADGAPKILKQVDPTYPPDLRKRGVNGEVVVELNVDAKGNVTEARAVSSSQPEFEAPAVQAAKRWKFTPGTRDGAASSMTVRMPVKFQSDLFDDTLLQQHEARPAAAITPPTPRKPIRVVYPYELAIAGETGHAEAVCIVDPNGYVSDAAVSLASAPAWASALRAAIEATLFEPAQQSGAAVEARWERAFEFGRAGSDAAIDAQTAQLIAQLKAGQKPVTPRELDRIPQRRSGSSPRLPIELWREGRGGTATIELFLGPDGRVLLLRAAKSDDERLAWAAMTAMQDWQFDAPLLNGQPTFARLGYPVNFAPPKTAPAPSGG